MSKPLPVEPTARTERFKVEEQDFVTAVSGDQYNCALAVCIQRTLPKAKDVRVNVKTVSWVENDARFRYPTPETAVDSVIKPLDTHKTGELKPVTVKLTNGTVRPVYYRDDDELERQRRYQRNWARNKAAGTVKEHAQMTGEDNPMHHGYGRFKTDG